MNVLSLFDGISCGRVALGRAGTPVSAYYSSEVDKYPMAVSADNHDDVTQLGSVEDWAHWGIDWESIDLVLAGSPCQGFSMLGQGTNFEHPQSKLFFDFLDVLQMAQWYNPDVKFLLENVRMKSEWVAMISNYLSVAPLAVDSKGFSAASRPRLYWFNWPAPELVPNDVRLSSILQKNVEGFDISGAYLNRVNTSTDVDIGFTKINPRKAVCQTASQYANWRGTLVKQRGRLRTLTPVECERLQTLPDDYTKCLSRRRRYQVLGNSWTVEVVAQILGGLK